MPRATLRLGSLLVVLLIVASSSWGAGGDAGSGQDAGGSASEGLGIAFGSYAGRLGPADRDWFRGPASSGASCVEASVQPVDNGASVTVGYEGASGKRVNAFAPRGATTTVGVAGLAWDAALLGVETTANKNDQGVSARPTDYAFSLRAIGFSPRSSADALTGADAASSLSEATPIAPGCVPGRLDPVGPTLGDGADAYRLDVPAGSFLTASFAAPAGAPVELRVYDAAGALVATVAPGGAASVAVPTSGTYYLSSARTSLVLDDVPYLVGVVVGPPDPGQGCRPACLG